MLIKIAKDDFQIYFATIISDAMFILDHFKKKVGKLEKGEIKRLINVDISIQNRLYDFRNKINNILPLFFLLLFLLTTAVNPMYTAFLLLSFLV